MARATASALPTAIPSPAVVLELLKPITWFPPMWAFGCGIVSAGVPLADKWPAALLGIVLAGPVACGTSQAVNDWFDRHVDAINEPGRPIPSGRMPGRWGLWIAIAGSVLALALAALLGPWVIAGTLVGVILSWAYSAPPVRLKVSGWWGPGAVGLSYEGLTWFTGAAAMVGGLPDWRIVALAALYSVGAHGIMTLNDFKAIEGDRATGVNSLPVVYGPDRAARIACAVMIVPQLAVVALLVLWGLPWHALGVAALIAGQFAAIPKLLADPRGRAPWYNGVGVAQSVLGMLVAAFGVGSLL